MDIGTMPFIPGGWRLLTPGEEICFGDAYWHHKCRIWVYVGVRSDEKNETYVHVYDDREIILGTTVKKYGEKVPEYEGGDLTKQEYYSRQFR